MGRLEAFSAGSRIRGTHYISACVPVRYRVSERNAPDAEEPLQVLLGSLEKGEETEAEPKEKLADVYAQGGGLKMDVGYRSKDKKLAMMEWESGKVHAELLDVVLFPSDYFDSDSVDPDLQVEYEAVKENEMLTPILFNYEAWFENGKLVLSDSVDSVTGAVYRGWMMKPEQYERFYEALRKEKLYLVTRPDEYCTLHMFPNVYEQVREDSARILLFPLHTPIDISLVRKSFPKFMVKDYVKSVKGTEFPKYFDENVTQEEFNRWMEVFYKYRGNLLTRGICIKEYLDLKRYDGKTNEYRMFYADGIGITLEPNSGQADFAPKPPRALWEKYRSLGSPFYTVDYAELADGSWKVIETGDGGVSGLSDRQDAGAFYRALYNAFR